MILLGFGSPFSYGQDSAFLACAKYTDREMRLSCLDITLTKAIRQQNSKANSDISVATDHDDVAAFGAEKQARDTQVNPDMSAATAHDRVDAFGTEKQARVVTTNAGREALVDEISTLNTIKPDMWYITLDSGQVWQQVHPKRFDLKKGDTVQISPSRWGNNFRLTTAKLSGFIQVSRVK